MIPISYAAQASFTLLPGESASQLRSHIDSALFFERIPKRNSYTCQFRSCTPSFLDWVLNLQHGKNGRRLPGVKCKSSLDTFWKVFRLVYRRDTSNKIGKQMNRQMRRV